MTPEQQTYTWPEFALAETPDSLNPEHPINVALREQGIGLTPNLAALDVEQRTVRLASGALQGFVTVPFGWHAIDDGRRLVVFNEANNIQIEFEQVATGNAAPEDLLAGLAAQIEQAYPDAKWITMELGGMPTIALRGLPIPADDGETVYLDQVFLLKQRTEGVYLQTRCTMAQDDTVQTLNMVELMLASIEWP
jgi:hypothetical protein